MTYRDLNEKIAKLEARDKLVSLEIQKSKLRVDSLSEGFVFVSDAIDKFGSRHEAGNKEQE